jgi:two-component system cell cycle sensor histidine kinase PleC
VGYGQRLRIQRNADARVLKAQLNLIADGLHGASILAPWGAILSAVVTSEFNAFGHAPLETTLILPAAVTIAALFALHVVRRYRAEIGEQTCDEELEPWFTRFMAAQAGFSAAWGILPWVFWQDGDMMNHVFIAFGSVLLLSWLVLSCISHLGMLIATLLPMATIVSLRFLFGDSAVAISVAPMLAGYSMLLFYNGKRVTKRIDEDSRLRFEVEDLARELEEARDEALRKRFEAETANASKTAFLANMSHELRTPLNAILGFSEIIAKECFGAVGSPRYIEYAGDIHSSGSHLLSLINDLLDVAKIEAGRMEIQPEPLDAKKTFDSALKLVGAKARERRQDLIITTSHDAPELYADERALKQILINLVSNAVKFTPEGGRITVVGGRARCGGFQIMVEDTGPGIPREKLDRIFKPFSQVDNRYDRQGGGTGLGLALVRGLAELHNGRAWLESEPGKGCRAYVVLPHSAVGVKAKKIESDAAAA